MNRRGFFGLIIGSITAAILPKPKITGGAITLEVCEKFVTGPVVPLTLYGIPYHQNDAPTSTWLGFERSE